MSIRSLVAFLHYRWLPSVCRFPVLRLFFLLLGFIFSRGGISYRFAGRYPFRLLLSSVSCFTAKGHHSGIRLKITGAITLFIIAVSICWCDVFRFGSCRALATGAASTGSAASGCLPPARFPPVQQLQGAGHRRGFHRFSSCRALATGAASTGSAAAGCWPPARLFRSCNGSAVSRAVINVSNVRVISRHSVYPVHLINGSFYLQSDLLQPFRDMQIVVVSKPFFRVAKGRDQNMAGSQLCSFCRFSSPTFSSL
nr:Uncharacterised protein [Klebsiella pneumoniae]VXZ93093.1 Uncharacterised protein [Klebsiella pneumoniae]